MKQITRHILSLVLTCAMLLSLLPAVALAEEPENTPNTAADTLADPAPVNEPEPEPDKTLYVSAEPGDTSKEAGTKENPYTSLAAAVNVAAEGEKTLIYVMSDLTITDSARYWGNKDVTIASDPDSLTEGQSAFTISRAETSFHAVQDSNRGGYNPGMIELGNGADLTLTNIILDDHHYAAYTNPSDPHSGTVSGQNAYFNQVASRGSEDDPGPGSTTIGGKEIPNHKRKLQVKVGHLHSRN